MEPLERVVVTRLVFELLLAVGYIQYSIVLFLPHGGWVGLTTAEVESAAVWSGCVLCRVPDPAAVHYVQPGAGQGSL